MRSFRVYGYARTLNPSFLTHSPLAVPQNSFNSRYLAEKLDIGSGAALAYGVKRNPLLRAKSSIASIAHKIDDMVRQSTGLRVQGLVLHRSHRAHG